MAVLDAALLRLRAPSGCGLAGNENLPPGTGLFNKVIDFLWKEIGQMIRRMCKRFEIKASRMVFCEAYIGTPQQTRPEAQRRYRALYASAPEEKI